VPESQATPNQPLAVTAAGAADLRRRLVLLTLARLAVATILLGIVTGFSPSPGVSPTSRGVLGVVVALYAASLGYAFGLRSKLDLRLLAWVQIGLDLAAWTALVYVTGGPVSPLSFFFGLSTLTAALVLGDNAARNTAVIAIATYGMLMVTMTYGIIAPLSDAVHRPEPSRPELALQLVTNSVGILLIAALGGSLASRVTRAGGALARSEASRAALAALYEDVLRSIPVALVTVAPDGRIDSANPQASTLFDRPVEKLLGASAHEILPFLPPDAFRAGNPPSIGDEVLAGPPQRPRITYRAAPLYDKTGAAHGGLVVIEDRSAVESMREAMQRAERLAVLGRLAAGLAHEIRNPLGAISGCVELVREGSALTNEDRDLLGTVLRETERLNRLVSDMLQFARPRAPEKTPTDVRALAREVVTLAKAESKAPIEFAGGDHDGEETPLIASLDAGQVRQVLWNLVRNASHVSPIDQPVVVTVCRKDGFVELCVDDAGPGIPEETRNRIFDVFYSETERGTGLGLAIVKQLVESHGGTVDVLARDGGGTRFAVRFPVA
jgi:two-component system sensor histidine kinase PilS (NtrC family)